MDFERKNLEDFTIRDWVMAKKMMNDNAFRSLRRTAVIARIPVPSFTAGRGAVGQIEFLLTGDNIAISERIQDRKALYTFRAAVKKWVQQTEKELRRAAPVSTAPYIFANPGQPTGKLRDDISSYIKMDGIYHKEPNRIGFRFPRHGVHIHKGAGRGFGGRVGSKWVTIHGDVKTTDPKSLGKAGTPPRVPQHWFDNVLARRLPELADICTKYCGEMIVNSEYLYLG